MKNIIVQFSIPNMTVEQYNQVTMDLESAGKSNIPERLYHVAAAQGDGWHVTDVWQSEEAFNNFAEKCTIFNKKWSATSRTINTGYSQYYCLKT
ncbi:MAG: hypothetical protein L3J34_11465 [Flavobacteriaceae bacterium]|nr:hypothetical protein [Flavobacteriaceae bacterium]